VVDDYPPSPLLLDEQATDDRFGSAEVTNRLAPILQQIDPPYTVSISGPWGVGKTTLTRSLKIQLEDASKPPQERVPVIEVDLWSRDLTDLRRTLALEAAVSLAEGTGSPREKKLEDEAKRLDRVLRATRTQQDPPHLYVPLLKSHPIWALVVLVAIVAVVWLTWGVTLQSPEGTELLGPRALVTLAVSVGVWLLIQSGLVFSVSTSTTSTPPIEEKVALQHRFEKLVTGSTRKVAIVLDNLDRLTGDDAVRALSEVRSFVDIPRSRCIFIIPLDRDALMRHLVKSLGGDRQAASDYLDKFFNLDIPLTKPVREDLRRWVRDDLVGKLFPKADPSVRARIAEIIAEASNGSPRSAKRITNGAYTRTYLLPKESRAMRFESVAYLEGLVQRFPEAVRRLSDDPRRWLEQLDLLRAASEGDELDRLTRWLSGLTESDSVEEAEAQKASLDALRGLLLFGGSIPLSEADVRAILTARPNRQWAQIARGAEISEALASGDAVKLASTLDGLAEGDADVALRVALDEIREDLRQGWFTGVLNGLNALAGVVGADSRYASDVRQAGDDFFGRSPAELWRTASSSLVNLLFGGGLSELTHGHQIIKSFTEEFPKERDDPASSLVEAVALVCSDLTADEVTALSESLVRLEDDELGPLFSNRVEDRLLLGVRTKYIERFTKWDPGTDSDQPPLVEAGRRLQRIQQAGWSDQADLDAIADRAIAQLPKLPAEAIQVFEQLIPILASGKNSPPITTFAQDLAQWAPGGIDAFLLAIRMPADPATMAPIINARLNAASLDEYRRLLESRDDIQSFGVRVAQTATNRWAAGQGSDYARWVLETGDEQDEDLLMTGLSGVADKATYRDLIRALAPVLVELKAERAAAKLFANLKGRIATLSLPLVAELAETVASLQGMVDPSQVVDAVRSAIDAATKAEVPLVTELTQAWVQAGVNGTEDLPGRVAERSAAHGTIDPERAGWLARQPGVDRPNVRTGVLGAIDDLPAATILLAVASLRSELNQSVSIGLALVARASREPVGSRADWLTEASAWHVPKRGNAEQYEAYGKALDAAMEGDPAAEAVVRELRLRLVENRS
jgi:hypothetical protein